MRFKPIALRSRFALAPRSGSTAAPLCGQADSGSECYL
ncbi:MAG: hypothetical protein KatS3mg049_1994 [Caldilinea sp.]|jgi:hypothetical protein|nr:MAG: hypothetical protein KatS3mg049_1994 [Caldilinea sp.]